MASMWRKDDPEFDSDGKLITGGMFSHQRHWWMSTAYIRALVGGYGCGKTGIQSKRGIAMALHNAPVPYMIVSPSYKMAKRTIVPHIKALLGGRGIRYKYNKTDNEILIYYKGRTGIIWLGSGDDPDALKGPNLCGAGIDEPFIQPREVFDQMMARVRDPKARHREITLTGTPEELNWGYDICEGEEAARYDIEVIHASTLDNKALPPDFAESLLKGYSKEMVAAYLNGEFVILGEGIIYRDYGEANLTTRTFKPGVIHWTHDFNYMPMSSAICQVEGDNIFAVDEIVLDHAVARNSAEEFVERYGNFKHCPVVLHGDPSGKAGEKHGQKSNYIEIENVLKDNGFNVTRRVLMSERSIRDSQNALRGKIKNAKGERTFFVNKEKCKTLHRGMLTAKTKKGSTFLEDDGDRHQHITTAIRYMVEVTHPPAGKATIHKVR